MSLSPRYAEPLPKCKGPKLSPFQDNSADIELIRLISDNDSEDTSEGGHAHVFEVSINSKTYALKVFKFYNDKNDRAALFGKEHDLISVDILRGHMDPFYNECRAYGRLIDANLNGKVAVRCHGYLTIPAEREEELREDFGVEVWNRPDSEYSKLASERQPFRAIVKDLISEDVRFTSTSAKKILRDLKRMRKLGIYPMDIQARNYKGGLLVDFSVAITEPHYLFVIKPRWRIEDYKLKDLNDFDSMATDKGVVTWERAVPNPEYCEKLRSHDSKKAQNQK